MIFGGLSAVIFCVWTKTFFVKDILPIILDDSIFQWLFGSKDTYLRYRLTDHHHHHQIRSLSS